MDLAVPTALLATPESNWSHEVGVPSVKKITTFFASSRPEVCP